MIVRVVVADDEHLSRALLVNVLKTFADVEVVAEARSGEEAVRLIAEHRPDLALLDLCMPGTDGFAVARLLKRCSTPLIAFVTAYEEHALKAFEHCAIDYLLKPVQPARLRQTIARVHEWLEGAALESEAADRLKPGLAWTGSAATPAAAYLRRIPVRDRDDILLVSSDRIAFIRAHGELLHLHTRTGEQYRVEYRLKELEPRLDPVQFVRISRAAIVNLDAIQRISPMPGGTYLVTVVTRQQLPVSRQRARGLRDYLFRL